MVKMTAPKYGIRAKICETVTVYQHKQGNLQFGKGRCMAVIDKFFDIILIRKKATGRKRIFRNSKPIRARRVSRNEAVTE